MNDLRQPMVLRVFFQISYERSIGSFQTRMLITLNLWLTAQCCASTTQGMCADWSTMYRTFSLFITVRWKSASGTSLTFFHTGQDFRPHWHAISKWWVLVFRNQLWTFPQANASGEFASMRCSFVVSVWLPPQTFISVLFTFHPLNVSVIVYYSDMLPRAE